MSKARAEIEITASTSRLASTLNAARAQFTGFASSLARGTGQAMAGAMSRLRKGIAGGITGGTTASRALGNFGGDMLTRGFDTMLGAADEVLEFEKGLVRFQIAAGKTPEEIRAIGDAMQRASLETGIARREIQAGANAYLALTGDVKGTVGAMGTFARIAQASGASVGDVATATAALRTAMKLDVAKDTEAAFSGLIAQGKAGAVEIKDFAGELAELAPQFAQFGGAQGLGGIRQMGAVFQILRNGAGSASGAATQFQAVMGEIVGEAKKLRKVGIEVFQKNPQTGQKELKNFGVIADAIANNKLLKNPEKVKAIFGRKESQAAIRSIQSYIGQMHELERAGEDTGAVQRDMLTYLESPAGRIEKSFNAIKLAVADAFTPGRIEAMAGAFEKLVPMVTGLVTALGSVGGAIGGVIDRLGDLGRSSEFQAVFDFASGGMLSKARGIRKQLDMDEDKRLTAEMTKGVNVHDPMVMAKRLSAGWTPAEVMAGDKLSSARQTAAATFSDPGAAMRRAAGINLSPTGADAFERTNAAYAYQGEAGGAIQARAETASVEARLAREERAAKMQADAAEALKNVAAIMATHLGVKTVQIGDNQVARSVDRSTDARRK